MLGSEKLLERSISSLCITRNAIDIIFDIDILTKLCQHIYIYRNVLLYAVLI